MPGKAAAEPPGSLRGEGAGGFLGDVEVKDSAEGSIRSGIPGKAEESVSLCLWLDLVLRHCFGASTVGRGDAAGQLTDRRGMPGKAEDVEDVEDVDAATDW